MPQTAENIEGMLKDTEADGILELIKNMDYAQAEKEIDLVIKKNSSDASAYHLLGVLRNSEEKYEESMKAFEKAFELNPKDFGICFNYGLSTIFMGKYHKAIGILKHTAEIFSGNAEPYVMLGWSYYHIKKDDTGKEYLRIAQKLDRDSAESLLDLLCKMTSKIAKRRTLH